MKNNEDILTHADLEILTDVLVMALYTEKYEHTTIRDFYLRFIHSIRRGDFKLARSEKNGLPLAFTAWAFVNDEVLELMLENNNRVLEEKEFDSGGNLLFMELFFTENYYWDFFDYLTNYFKSEYNRKEIIPDKIFTCCGMNIDFNDGNAVIRNAQDKM